VTIWTHIKETHQLYSKCGAFSRGFAS